MLSNKNIFRDIKDQWLLNIFSFFLFAQSYFEKLMRNMESLLRKVHIPIYMHDFAHDFRSFSDLLGPIPGFLPKTN